MLKYTCKCNLSFMNDLGHLQMYFVLDRCDHVGEFRCGIFGHVYNVVIPKLAPVYGYYAATKVVNGEKDLKCKGLDILQIKD